MNFMDGGKGRVKEVRVRSLGRGACDAAKKNHLEEGGRKRENYNNGSEE